MNKENDVNVNYGLGELKEDKLIKEHGDKATILNMFFKALEELEFKESTILQIKESEVIDNLVGLPDYLAKSSITFYLNGLMISREKEIPTIVRLALLEPAEDLEWVTKVIDHTLPYLKEHEDYYFG